ncbi:hypothetical protein, partial [Brevibacterium aurantiacum]|uniref:hypothetical protein n=1 Tax=Brevibacterium aurantiacum TaxID=273384 RepID=UPI00196A54AB
WADRGRPGRGGDAADRVIRSPTPLLNTKLKELPKNTTKRDLTIEIPQTANDKDLRTGGKYKKKYYTVKFTQTNMKYKCKGTKKHKWSASSIGRLRYQGRTLWARVTSPILSVPCGPH